MSITTITSQTPATPAGHGPAYLEGQIDAVTELRHVVTARAAEARTQGYHRWADDYEAGAASTWVLLDRLDAHLEFLGAVL